MSREMRSPNIDPSLDEAPRPGEPADPIDPEPANPPPIPSPDGDPQPRSPEQEPDPPPIGDPGLTEPTRIATDPNSGVLSPGAVE